eukprot:jgi/Botrbrau1/23425/Bobra.0051s0066.1
MRAGLQLDPDLMNRSATGNIHKESYILPLGSLTASALALQNCSSLTSRAKFPSNLFKQHLCASSDHAPSTQHMTWAHSIQVAGSKISSLISRGAQVRVYTSISFSKTAC